MRHWQVALGRIRLRGPDNPPFNKDVKYVYNHIAQLEAALRRELHVTHGEDTKRRIEAALQEKGD